MNKNVGLLREWNKRYMIEFVVAWALCLAASAFCIPLARTAGSPVVRISLMAVPTLAVLVIAFVVLRQFRRVDEFLRHVMLECFAVAGAVALVATLAYGIFEAAGFHRLSMWWGFAATSLAWNLWMLRVVTR